MGSIFSSNEVVVPKAEPVKILVTGLDASGKTTMLYRLKMEDTQHVRAAPKGFTIETGRYKNLEILSWEADGTKANGALLKKYYAEEVMGVIYVIDMNDRELLPESIVQLRAELSYVEHNRNPGQVPVLIFANKMDLPNAMAINELKESVEFRSIVKNRAWDVQPSCATSCEGLAEGFDWLAKQIEINRSSLKVTATCHKPNDEQ